VAGNYSGATPHQEATDENAEVVGLRHNGYIPEPERVVHLSLYESHSVG